MLIKYFGSKQSIIIGLGFQVAQLAAYSFAAQPWLIWFSGLLAAISSIGYPAISAYISNQSHVDQQGVSQGMVTGIRGLCNGIGPALYGFIFWIFRVNLSEISAASKDNAGNPSSQDGTGEKITYASTVSALVNASMGLVTLTGMLTSLHFFFIASFTWTTIFVRRRARSCRHIRYMAHTAQLQDAHTSLLISKK